MAKWSDEELHAYTRNAESGDVASQIWLGWAYWEGKFISPDLSLSLLWLDRAAASDDPEAMYRLASFCYATGRNDRVIDLLSAAIDKDFSPAAFELGNHYYVGELVEKDVDRAVAAWQQAVALGHIPAKAQIVKHRMRAAPLITKPLHWLTLLPITLRAARCFWKNPNDPRILGT